MNAIIRSVAEEAPALQADKDGFFEIEGDYTFKLEHEGTTIGVSADCTRTYLADNKDTPPAWRIFHDWDRTEHHMPADWSPERVVETFRWFLRGEEKGESYGISAGKRQIRNAISELRDLGIGTVLLPRAEEE